MLHRENPIALDSVDQIGRIQPESLDSLKMLPLDIFGLLVRLHPS